MKKSVTKRFKVTKQGKLLRRPMAVDHFRSKKTGPAKQQKRKFKALRYSHNKIVELMYKN